MQRLSDYILERKYNHILERYANDGLKALEEFTPKDTGKTSQSWSYSIKHENGRFGIYWSNSNIQNGLPIALIIQYGHGTGTGGYVSGVDYINPALKPIFDNLMGDIWKEVTSQ